MKTICVVFIFIIVFVLLSFFAAPNIVEFVGRRQVPEMTPEKAQKFFETVGGVNEVNREAKLLFNQLGTNDLMFLYPQDLTNAPAISSLYSICKNYPGNHFGPFISVSSENGRHLGIGFGNHWLIKDIYIFDPNAAITFNTPSNWFQVTSNIFVSR
jgi:hypothetical protein